MPQLSLDRRAKYERLEQQVGGTPLYELRHMDVPNECRIFCKEEHRNPTGSHYDRQTVRFLRGYEEEGRIAPGGRPLLETTTGSSGASFAWMCRVLDYNCVVFIPKDMPSARIEQIISFGAEVRFAPEKQYIGGLIEAFRGFVLGDADVRKSMVPTNHSKDVTYAPEAMRELGVEIVGDLAQCGLERPDYFVAALGNGISARGVGEALAREGTKLIGMEPYESPSVLEDRFPERFAELYPDGHTATPHEIYGTGAGADMSDQFPNLKAIKGQLTDIVLPRPEDWRRVQRELLDLEGKHVGNSSAACVWAALQVAERAPKGSVIVTIFYDAYWRYLPIRPLNEYNGATMLVGDD